MDKEHGRRKTVKDALEDVVDLKFNSEKVIAVHDLCSSSVENPDESRKGTFDREIQDVLEYLNGVPQFVSTSSCSGRVIVFSQEGKGKGTCRWHLVCHGDDFTENKLVENLRSISEDMTLKNDVFLKFEPFILHIRCRTLADGQALAGFRNSGITIRRKGKEGFAIHVAVRCTLHFEMPVTLGGKFIIFLEHLPCVAAELRDKMDRNSALILRFFEALKAKFPSPPAGSASQDLT